MNAAARPSLKHRARSWVKAAGRRWLASGPRVTLPPQTWGLSHHDGRLHLGGVDLSALLLQYGSPLHVVDEARLLANLHSFQAPDGPGSGVEVFYSYKTNPLPWVLRRLHDAGAGAEVISEYELWLALRLGVPGERILYNGPAKSERSLRWAIEQQVLAVHLNHWEEIDRVQAQAQQMGQRLRVALRITSVKGWTGQFGFSVEDGRALAAYRHALAQPALDVVGVHCHRGVLIHDAATLRGHIGMVLGFCDTLQQTLGWSPQLLDLGGSLAVPSTRHLSGSDVRHASRYLRQPPAPDVATCLTPAAYARAAVQQVRAHFSSRSLPQPRLLAEPGRALTGNSQFLLTQVMDVRHETDFDYAILDAGVSIASIVPGEYHELFPLRPRAEAERCHRLVGPICHMGDTLYLARYVPPLQRGDGLAIMDSGAYFVADSSAFSFPRPGAVVVHADGSHSIARQPESFEHLCALDHMPAPAQKPAP